MMIFLLTFFVIAEKITTLSEINKPDLMEISDGKLYIMEGSTVFLYDLKDKKLIKKFCKRGEGPRELKMNPGIPNFLVMTSDSVIAVSMDKAIEFSKDGEFKREMKIPGFTNYLHPVKDGYISVKFNVGKNPSVSVKLIDLDLKEKKTLYSQKFTGGQNKIDLTFDGVHIAVEDNVLYIEESALGFEISRFDLEGNPIDRIKKEVAKIPFSNQHEAAAIENLKSNPQIKQMGWENFKNAVKIIKQKYMPPIQDMLLDNGNIYIQTNTIKDGTVEFWVLNKRGKVLKKVFLPKPMESSFISKMFGRPGRFYKFHRDTYYYIVENEEEEEWELHALAVKL